MPTLEKKSISKEPGVAEDSMSSDVEKGNEGEEDAASEKNSAAGSGDGSDESVVSVGSSHASNKSGDESEGENSEEENEKDDGEDQPDEASDEEDIKLSKLEMEVDSNSEEEGEGDGDGDGVNDDANASGKLTQKQSEFIKALAIECIQARNESENNRVPRGMVPDMVRRHEQKHPYVTAQLLTEAIGRYRNRTFTKEDVRAAKRVTSGEVAGGSNANVKMEESPKKGTKRKYERSSVVDNDASKARGPKNPSESLHMESTKRAQIAVVNNLARQIVATKHSSASGRLAPNIVKSTVLKMQGKFPFFSEERLRKAIRRLSLKDSQLKNGNSADLGMVFATGQVDIDRAMDVYEKTIIDSYSNHVTSESATEKMKTCALLNLICIRVKKELGKGKLEPVDVKRIITSEKQKYEAERLKISVALVMKELDQYTMITTIKPSEETKSKNEGARSVSNSNGASNEANSDFDDLGLSVSKKRRKMTAQEEIAFLESSSEQDHSLGDILKSTELRGTPSSALAIEITQSYHRTVTDAYESAKSRYLKLRAECLEAEVALKRANEKKNEVGELLGRMTGENISPYVARSHNQNVRSSNGIQTESVDVIEL